MRFLTYLQKNIQIGHSEQAAIFIIYHGNCERSILPDSLHKLYRFRSVTGLRNHNQYRFFINAAICIAQHFKTIAGLRSNATVIKLCNNTVCSV